MFEHAVEREQGEFGGFGVYADDIANFHRAPGLIDGRVIGGADAAEPVEDPQQVRLIDSVHGCAQTLAVAEHTDMHALGLQLVGHAVDEMDLGADGPLAAGRRIAEGVDDVLGRAGVVREVNDLLAALGVHKDLRGFFASGQRSVCAVDLGAVLGAEELVDAAMSCPQNSCGVV